MKTLSSLCLAIFVGCATATTAFAEILPKDVIEVKDTFDKNGASSCSKALADTINFLADGRAFTYNALWGTEDTNKKPISLDFLISGGKGDYSGSGSIVLIPIGDKCIGAYVLSFVAPSHNCEIYMKKVGADGQDWNHNSKYNNGDGGTAYFSTLKNNSNANFIFNDVAGGCSMTKREMINLEVKK